MADHVRKQLRDAVVAALMGLPSTGPRVYASRTHQVRAAEAPCLVVYASTEDARPETFSEELRRSVTVRVDAYARATADLDDVLDQVAKEVEIALFANLTVGGKSVRLQYAGCELQFDGDTGTETGVAEMRFSADIFTAAGIPDALIDG